MENPKEEVIQNLKDAGCSKETIQKFLCCCESKEKEAQVEVLEHHRKKLLRKIHTEERQISCLDYLIYQIQKEEQQTS
nr:hypothetical protein [uncultured Sellimonas sp.]